MRKSRSIFADLPRLGMATLVAATALTFATACGGGDDDPVIDKPDTPDTPITPPEA